MSAELIIRRRPIGDQELELIRNLIAEEGGRGRSHISNRLCHIWDWRQPNGQYRQIACRDLLRQLEAKALIQLPPMLSGARRPGYQNTVRLPELFDQTRLEGSLAECRPHIQLTLVQEKAQRELFKGLIGAHHYLGYQQATGAQLKYLAFHQERPIGCLSFGPAAYKVAARDQFIGWSPGERIRRLSWLVNNERFLIFPSVRVPHLASWLLSRCLQRLRRDWQQVYQHDLVLCETFVEQDRFQGQAYAAANWTCVGQTQGRGRNDRLNQARLPLKTIWLKALRPDFRRLLCAQT